MAKIAGDFLKEPGDVHSYPALLCGIAVYATFEPHGEMP